MEELLHGLFRPTESLGVRGMSLRPSETCRFATPLCAAKGYCHKFEKWPRNGGAWDRNQRTLDAVTPDEFAAWVDATNVAAKGRPVRYRADWLRWGKIGEPCSTVEAVKKLASLIAATPKTKHSLPTKAWRDQDVWEAVVEHILPLKNAKVILSFDVSVDDRGPYLIADYYGLRTMFFGDDRAHPWAFPKTPFRVVRCPKTWVKPTPVDPCRACRACYVDQADGKPAAIWLKQHN